MAKVTKSKDIPSISPSSAGTKVTGFPCVCKHCGACRVVKPSGEWQYDCECYDYTKRPKQEPNSNAMIIEQVDGAIKVALDLLAQMHTETAQEEIDVNGLIWTLEGWYKYNLGHLRKAFK